MRRASCQKHGGGETPPVQPFALTRGKGGLPRTDDRFGQDKRCDGSAQWTGATAAILACIGLAEIRTEELLELCPLERVARNWTMAEPHRRQGKGQGKDKALQQDIRGSQHCQKDDQR